MRKAPIDWEWYFKKVVLPPLMIVVLISVVFLIISGIRGCIRGQNEEEITPDQYGEITKWAENGWTGAYPKLKEAIEAANEDEKISRQERRELNDLYERCRYEDARRSMLRTIENPPQQKKEKSEDGSADNE